MKRNAMLLYILILFFGTQIMAMERVQEMVGAKHATKKKTCKDEFLNKDKSDEKPWANLYYAYPGTHSPVHDMNTGPVEGSSGSEHNCCPLFGR